MRTLDVVRVKEIEKLFSRPANYDEILQDISSRGIQEPVVVNTNNELLCGYTRLAIGGELELDEIPHRTVEVVDHDDMIEYAILDNIRRRQLSDLQLVKCGIKLEALYGNRQGQRTDLQSQAGNLWTDCPEVKENGNTRDIVADKIGAMSGRKYDRFKKISHTAPEVQDKFEKHLITQKDALALTKVDHTEQVEIIQSGLSNITRKVKKTLKEHEKQKVKDQGKDFEPIPGIEILCSDIAEVGEEIEDNSVDLILTDPPYAKSFLHCWQSLAEFAERVLKQSGFLVSYSGVVYLDRVIQILSEKLDYYCLIPLLHKGNTKLEHSRGMRCKYKPILVYAKPPVQKVETYFENAMTGSGRSKELHEWQQGLDELYPLLDTFSKTGDTVVDPFAGSGTALIAAYEKGRRVIGIEQNEETVKIIKGRLSKMRDHAC